MTPAGDQKYGPLSGAGSAEHGNEEFGGEQHVRRAVEARPCGRTGGAFGAGLRGARREGEVQSVVTVQGNAAKVGGDGIVVVVQA